jgi:hypothetical protein
LSGAQKIVTLLNYFALHKFMSRVPPKGALAISAIGKTAVVAVT